MGTYRCAEMGEEPEDEVCGVVWVMDEVCDVGQGRGLWWS